MFVYQILFNTCDFNTIIFENIVKNLWAIIEDIDEDRRSCEKQVMKHDEFPNNKCF